MNNLKTNTKQFTVQVFVVLGVVFLVVLLFAGYFYIADPYGLKPLLLGDSASQSASPAAAGETAAETDTGVAAQTEATAGFTLSEPQRAALVALGIDPTSVPSEVSAAQEECFREVLGGARVEEVKAGAVPSAIELMRAQACI